MKERPRVAVDRLAGPDDHWVLLLEGLNVYKFAIEFLGSAVLSVA